MESYHVYIPSRGRPQNAAKLAMLWRIEGFIPHFVVEPNEAHQYEMCIRFHGAYLEVLPVKNGGIGNSRNHCVNLAASWGYRSIILADDDIKPGKNANMQNLAECASHSKVLGITARYSYHDLCLGPQIRGRDDLILMPTGAFRLVALNIDNVLDIGNYDKNLEYAEDCDLFLRGLQAGYPWMVHLGTWSNSMGTRYEPGGLLDFATKAYQGATSLYGDKELLQLKKQDWHKELYSKWPDFVNDPARVKDWGKQNTIRIAWQRAYDKLLPGWREWSALHGGYINDYFGIHK